MTVRDIELNLDSAQRRYTLRPRLLEHWRQSSNSRSKNGPGALPGLAGKRTGAVPTKRSGGSAPKPYRGEVAVGMTRPG